MMCGDSQMPNKRMHTNRRPRFGFDASDFPDTGFAASACCRRRSVILDR